MTEIRTSINTGYTELLKKDSSRAKEAKIDDKASVNDNVIDLTDAKNLVSELNQSEAKFIKVSEDSYLKLDLSNPDLVKKLLGDLKKNILSEDGKTVLKNFNYVEFSQDTGITIQRVGQAQKVEIAPKPETERNQEKPLVSTNISFDEQKVIFAEINSIKEEIKNTSPKDTNKLKELNNKLENTLIKIVDSSMTEDIKKLLDLSKENKLNKTQITELNNIITKYKDNSKIKELITNFDLISDKNINSILDEIPDPKVKESISKIINENKSNLLPEGSINLVALPINKENFNNNDAILELNKLAEIHPEIKELMTKIDTNKATGKSLKLMGITKEDLALYLTTGQQSPKMQEAMQKAFKTGNWPAVNSVIEFTRLHRMALEDRVKNSQSKIDELYKSLSSISSPQDLDKAKAELFKLKNELSELQKLVNSDTSLLKTLPDSALRARTSVSERAIRIFDSQLSKLDPNSTEYANVKKKRDQEIVSLKNDASSLDSRIDKAESKGKRVSPDLKNLAANVHTTTAGSDISMFNIESTQKQKDNKVSETPSNPPPASELLIDAEKHVSKVEKYTIDSAKNIGVQDLKLSLHQAQRQDSKDRLKATGVVYDEKSKTFKYPIPNNYKPENKSSSPVETNYSSQGSLISEEKETTILVTDAQKQIEKEYHVAGIKTLDTIDKEKQILKSQIPDRFSKEPTDPKEAKQQIQIISKLASLESSANEIKIEQNNIVIAEQKADKEFDSTNKGLLAKEDKYNGIAKQKEGISTQIKALNEQLGEIQAEIDDWKDNYIFDNPEKQKELETLKSKGRSALILLQNEYERLNKTESTLVPPYSTDDKSSGSIAQASEAFRLSSGKLEISSAQSQALKDAYRATGKTTNLKPEVLLEVAKRGIEESDKVFDTAPEWMKSNPEFKAQQAHHLFSSSANQRLELTPSVEFVATEKAKKEISLPNSKEERVVAEQKADKTGIEAGLNAKQQWDTQTVVKIEQAEKLRVSLKNSKELDSETKQSLAIESITSQTTVASQIANTIPDESLRLLGRSYDSAEVEISPDIPNASGTHPLQTDLMSSIGQTALDCVGTSFKRDLVFKGQKALTESDISASQNLLNLTQNIANTLSQKNGGLEASQKLKDAKQKWDNSLKVVNKQINEHKENLKSEKSLVLDALDYQIHRTKEAASGHFIAASIWSLRDSLETDDPKDAKALELNYDKIDLDLLDKARISLEKRYDNQINQINSFSESYSLSLEGNRGLQYLSALKLYSETLEDNSFDIKQAQNIAKEILSKGKLDISKLVNLTPNQWDPVLKSWSAKAGLSEQGAGIKEEASSIQEQTGSLVAGGYQKEINDAKQMESKYIGMSVTDVFGVDTTGWEIENEYFKWLNTVGSVLNKTDTVAMIAEIALTEVLTAGLGSAVAAGRLGKFIEEVAVNYPKIEKAIALAKSVSSFLPNVISGEKNAANALRLIGQIAKNDKTAIRMMAGMRKLEQGVQVGANASKLRTLVNGSVHMGQVIAVQQGMNLAAQRLLGEHSLGTKFIEFTGQFLFVNSASKFSGIKDFSGRLAMNFALAYGQQHTASLVTYGIEKAMEISNASPLTPDQKLEAKKWGERVSIAAGVVVPSIIGVMHGSQLTPDKLNELSSFHTESLNSGLAKDSHEYKQLKSNFSDYLKESTQQFISPQKAKESLKNLQQLADKLPVQSKEALHSFIKQESAKLAIKEMPKLNTNDPNLHAQYVEKYLNELNGRDGLLKYDSNTIKRISTEQAISKAVEGVSKLEINHEKLNNSKEPKLALEEKQKLINDIKSKKEQLTEKLSNIKTLDPNEAKEIINTSMRMSLEELVNTKGINKDSLFAILEVGKEIGTDLTIKVKPEDGLPSQEFNVKLVKKDDGTESIEISREGYKTIKLNKNDITDILSDGNKIELKLKEGIKIQQTQVVKSPETSDTSSSTSSTPVNTQSLNLSPELKELFNNVSLVTKDDVKHFIETKKEDITKFLEKNINEGNHKNIIDFYKTMGGWENIKALDGKISPNVFESIHKARDLEVKRCWDKVLEEAKKKGFELEDGYVGTPPSDDPQSKYKKAWSDVDFSVKIKKSDREMTQIERHMEELELMQFMQKNLQESFEGAPSHIVDSNAYASPLVLDIGKGKAIDPVLKSKDLSNQKEMDFYQIRLGFGKSESGLEAYSSFKKETLELVKTKAESLTKKGQIDEAKKLLSDIEKGFNSAESRFEKLNNDLKSKVTELKEKNPNKPEKVLEEMALTELRYKEENDLISFMRDNKKLLEKDSPAGQEKRIEFNQKSREMRALWPEAYIGDQAALWGASGKEMATTMKNMSNAQRMEARVSQDQFKLHWLVEVRQEKDLSTRLLKASKYDLRDIDFKKLQMESITGKSDNVSDLVISKEYKEKDTHSIENIKAYTSKDFPEQAAFKEIKDYAKNPTDAEKIWIKHFGVEPDKIGSAKKALETYLSTIEAITTMNLYNHLAQKPLDS